MRRRSVRYRFGSHKLPYLADAMVDQPIGLEETDDGVWAIHFNNILLATFDETRLHHHRLTASVTNHAGLLCYPSSPLFRRDKQ